jgi:fructose-1,6-bisphosphatase/inositol monophosphatase family enzyme
MNYKQALSDALAAAMIGSNMMMSFYKKDYRTRYKQEDGQDLQEMIFTEADDKTQKPVLDYLLSRYWPEIGIFAEEGEWRNESSRFNRPFHWQIDPGSKAFKDRIDDFGISVALVSQEGRAFVGVLHHPAEQILAYAGIGETALLNGKPIVPPERNIKDCLKIIVSPNQVHKPKTKRALDLFDHKSFVKVRSTVMKALCIFAGEADLFFGLPGVPVHSWDLAAVAIIAEQSGYVLTDIKGERINLNHKESIWPHGYILCNELIHNIAVDRLSQWQND